MKQNHLIILLILLIVISLASYYVSLAPSEPQSETDYKEGKFTISEEPEEVIEEVEVEEKQEEVVMSDELPKQETIEIFGTVFSPKTITITKGTTVVWVNEDNSVHQIKEVSADNLFRSMRINPGQSFSYKFNEPGEYKYIDTIYTYMSGKVIVQNEGLPAITGNVVGFSKNPANVVTLLIFLALGFVLIHTIEGRE